MNRKYNQEHVDWLKANIKGCRFKDLTEKFNERFGMNSKVTAVAALAYRNGLKNGIDAKFNKGWEPTQFKKGQVPWNKGKKGVGGWKPTQFKKGQIPANFKPVGSERINVDGYVEVKIANPNKWRMKHQLVWEQHNGPIPKGHVVIFGDRNKLNFDINNLLLVSRRQLLILNRKDLIQKDKDLTKTAIIMADLYHKINERTKKGGQTGAKN